MTLTFTIDGKSSSESFPGKESGFTGTATCEAGVEASWDNEEWSLVLNNSNNQNNIVCNVDFSNGTKATEYITALASTSSEIVDDETEDHNLRYITYHGTLPRNYVLFNGELWRIIGVMNDVADENGTIEPRIKLIRNESIGRYAWDNKPSGTGSSTSKFGSNNWTDSALMKVLNEGAYYNRTSGTCPKGSSGATTPCNFSNNGLTNEAKEMISEVKWNISPLRSNTVGPSGIYEHERDPLVNSGLTTEWIGKVGLMYPSDFGFATGGGSSTTARKSCLDKYLANWSGDSMDCSRQSWLYKSDITQWTISAAMTTYYNVYTIYTTGGVISELTAMEYNVFPSVYLNTNTKIKSGTGSSTNPFILSK